MSSSYSAISKRKNILHTMLNVASTESFQVVREQFFKSYLANVVAEGSNTLDAPAPSYAPGASQLQQTLSKDNDIVQAEAGVTSWKKAAENFESKIPRISKYANFGYAEQKVRLEQIEAALMVPGTPYEKVGYVLAWFKTWRAEERRRYGRHPNDAYDTKNYNLQTAMTELVLDVAYAMIADERHAPSEALHNLRNQPKSTVCNDPTLALIQPTGGYAYSSYRGKGAEQRKKGRETWVEQSNKYREQLEHASPWIIAMDWSWKKSLCFADGDTVKNKTVPPIYTLGKYMLIADANTWDRKNVCNALVMEKTLISPGCAAQSGLEIGLAANPHIDINEYNGWWKEQERSSARDWRYIRRSSVLLTTKSKLEDITIGDAVARLKKFGPTEVLIGVFSNEDEDIKALLLERIQPNLGKTYTMLKGIEDSMGPMPEVIAQSLNTQLQKHEPDQAELGPDISSIFS